jgi:HlyD family secretion protein
MWLVLVLAGIATVVYWVRFSPVVVRTATVERGTIVEEVMGTGTLEPRIRATISPKTSGRIQAIAVDQGDRVTAGETLMTLDDEELRQQVAIAHANHEAAGAKVERLRADRGRASSVLAQAKRHFSRVQDLYARSVAASEEVEKATESLQIAEAGLSSAESAIVEAQKELIAAEETLNFQQTLLDDATVRAPFDGLVVDRRRDPGDVVVPGSPVLSLIETSELWVSAWVDETAMARLRPGQPARVVFRSEPDTSAAGRVARLGREADRETREFVVDVHALELPENWAVGQRAEVYIETDRRDSAMLIPARFVAWRADRPGVFVDQEGQAAWHPIQTGFQAQDNIEVVEGLEEGQTVVVPVAPNQVLTDGRRIRVP